MERIMEWRSLRVVPFPCKQLYVQRSDSVSLTPGDWIILLISEATILSYPLGKAKMMFSGLFPDRV